jgi:hypothetical protein
MNQKHLKRVVFMALDNCRDNGYDTMNKPREVVDELKEYDSDLEREPVKRLLPLVKEWQKKFGSMYADFVVARLIPGGLQITTRMYRDSSQACVTTMSRKAARELRDELNRLYFKSAKYSK